MNTNNNTNTNNNNNNNKTDILNSFHQNMYYVTSNPTPCSCVTLSFYNWVIFFTMVRCVFFNTMVSSTSAHSQV